MSFRQSLNNLFNRTRPIIIEEFLEGERRRNNPQQNIESNQLLAVIQEFNQLNRLFLQNPDYRESALQYNIVMRSFLELLLLNQRVNRTTPTPQTTTNPRMDLFFDIPMTPRLTTQQISQYTRILPYDTSMNETSCPITMEDFVVGENICQINSCGHIFKPDALTHWLQTHDICPMCRQRISGERPTDVGFIQNLLRSILNDSMTEHFSININPDHEGGDITTMESVD